MALALLFLFLFFSMQTTVPSFAIDHMQRGYSATPDTSSSSFHFQPLLSDATSNFSLGFLLVGSSNLDVAVVHVPSSFPLWRAAPSTPFSWSSSTSLLFNGSLVLVDKLNSLSWSTGVDNDGDRLTLLSSSNLQIINASKVVVWQSFDFPSDSIVQNQNFTSKSILVSTNQQYSMKLGSNFLALGLAKSPGAVYWKHTALETKAQIVEGGGPIYARLDPTGFLGLYQTEKAPLDVMSFDTFNSGTPKSLRRLTIEPDGNLREYYYSNGSGWVSEFAAVTIPCGLPSACGAYGLCYADDGTARCDCLDNRTANDNGCFASDPGDPCGAGGYRVLRRTGVDLANKDLIGFEKVSSLEECETLCQNNCSCRGAVYSNTSGNCYRIEYPIQTVVAVDDERKIGYFKVSNAVSGTGVGRRRARVALVAVGVVVLVCGCGLAGCRVWRRRRRSAREVDGELPEGMPYKGLSSVSFRNLELTHSFSKG